MPVLAFAQLNLQVTVHCEEAGTLFVKIQEQIEELGELKDISELTVTGQLNQDDYNVICNQLTNLTTVDLGGATNVADESKLRMQFRNAKLVTAKLPHNLTVLKSRCFYKLSNLESVSLPDVMTTFESEVFTDCSKLTSIQLPPHLTTIKGGAFAGTPFTAFTLPPGVKLDGSSVFAGCGSLESFTFSDGIDGKDMGTYTFDRCYKLKSLRLPQGITEIPDGFLKNTAVENFEIPSTVQRIGYQALYEISKPARIVIPEGVTYIGSQCFYLAKGIEELVWPSTCTTMNSDMFRYCSNLKSITLPETLDSLSGYNHFMGCTSLVSIHMPEGIRTLSGGTFSGCYKLEEVNIPAACTHIEGTSFYDCNKLSHVDIPDAVNYIGNMAFFRCPLQDEELKLPSHLKVLGTEVFAGGQYSKVTVPEGCLSIGHNAFNTKTLKTLDLPSTLLVIEGPLPGTTYSSTLESVTMHALVPPYVRKSDLLTASDKGRATLYVPAASLPLYQADSRYANGAASIEAIGGYAPTTGTINIVGNVTLTADCGLGNGKYDLNFFQQQLNRAMIGNNYDSDHPRLTIEEGATLHTATITMTCDRHDNKYSSTYNWDVLINRGTCTADNIDLRWRMKDLDYYCPPFDTRMSDVKFEVEGTPLAIYRYDAAARAVGNFDGTWVRLTSSDMLKAGQGYLVRTQPMISWWDDYYHRWEYNYGYMHHRTHSGGKEYFTTANDIVLPMTHAAGEFEHNKNWNLVGQPYPAYFDIRGIDYDGPILLPTGNSSRRWQAFSPLDDEQVLEPMQAFFVQVPDGVNSLTLLADRRQTGLKFVKGETANSRLALRRADKNSQRWVFNLELSGATGATEPSENPAAPVVSEAPVASARTRFVINPEATMRYDIGRDAPAMGADSCLMLYTYQGGVAYAINERPLDDGIIRLGMQIPEPGTYTLTLTPKPGTVLSGSTVETIWLIDNETGTRTQLFPQEAAKGVTIEVPSGAAEGAFASRFVIAIGNAEPTAIDEAEVAVPQRIDGMFNLAGQRIGQPRKGLYVKDGRIVFNK